MPDHPTPTDDVPPEVADTLQRCTAAQLRAVATYADCLATYRSAADGDEPQQAMDTEDDTISDGVDDPASADEARPAAVPAKATVTVKEINENRYYYWQWRDGDAVKSKYKGPVDRTE